MYTQSLNLIFAVSQSLLCIYPFLSQGIISIDIWFSGHDGIWLKVRLDDIGGLFHP